MKKMIVLMMMGLSTIGFSEWNVSYRNPDELKGVEGYHIFAYENISGAQFVVYDTPDMQIKVICPEYSFFDHEDWGEFCSDSYNGQYFCIAKVGFYKNGKLVKSGRMPIFVERDKTQLGFIKESKFAGMSDKEIAKEMGFASHVAKRIRDIASSIKKVEIYNALCTDGMSVRIIAPRYGKSDYDITIPANDRLKSIKWIPANRKRLKMEAQQREMAAAAKMIAEREEKIAREKEEARQAKVARLKELETKYPELEAKSKRCKDNGYTFTLKKVEAEMKSINEEILKLKKELGIMNSEKKDDN